MKSVGAAKLVFGIILAAIGLFLVFIGAGNRVEEALIVGIIFLAVGVLLIILYAVSNARVNEYNRQYVKPYRGKVLITNCHYCHHDVTCHAEQFRAHRNYPEGYVYCPVCKKPLSINAFRAVYEGRPKALPDYYEYDLDEQYNDYYDE